MKIVIYRFCPFFVDKTHSLFRLPLLLLLHSQSYLTLFYVYKTYRFNLNHHYPFIQFFIRLDANWVDFQIVTIYICIYLKQLLQKFVVAFICTITFTISIHFPLYSRKSVYSISYIRFPFFIYFFESLYFQFSEIGFMAIISQL